jgi:hypothetical protein
VNTMTARLMMDAWLILIVIYLTLNLFNFIFGIHLCKMYFVLTAVGIFVLFDSLEIDFYR